MIIFRDIGMYLVATVVTLFFAVLGEITWVSSLILLLIYVTLVVVVLVEEIRWRGGK
jgi:membrane protease YdiL (CAAX protease family)